MIPNPGVLVRRAKAEYCAQRALPPSDKEQLELRLVGRNGRQDYVFGVTGLMKGVPFNSLWECERNKATNINDRLNLTIPATELNVTKLMAANIINSRLGEQIHPSDIAKVVMEADKVSVIMSLDALLYTDHFTIKRV